MIQVGSKTVYFSRDSAFGSHFESIGKTSPNIDVALISAGPYASTWFTGQHHEDPYQALEAPPIIFHLLSLLPVKGQAECSYHQGLKYRLPLFSLGSAA